MKNSPVNTLGFKDLSYDVPSTAEEFDQLAGRVGACVDEANANIKYRGTLTDFRASFLHGLHVGEGDKAINIAGVEETTGIERKREPVLDKDGKQKTKGEDKEPLFKFIETEEDYFDRVLATIAQQNTESGSGPTTVDAVRATFKDTAQEILSSPALAFDPKRQERLPAGPKKVPQYALRIAEKIVKGGGAEASASKLTSLLGYEVKPDVESLGRAIAENERREKEAAAKNLESKYA